MAKDQRTAILVIHGMGQQRPFQPLDAFVRGLRDALKDLNNTVQLTHFLNGRQTVFDHYIRIECIETDNLKRPLDVYEYYWAPITQGGATFVQILSWFCVTVLTPLKRLAYNLPLVMQKGKKLTLTGQFWSEIWRVVWIPLAGLTIAGFVVILVKRSVGLVGELTKALRAGIPPYQTWTAALPDTFTGLVFLGAGVAVLAIFISLPEQIRDLIRLRRIRPGIIKLLLGLIQDVVRASVRGWVVRIKEGLSGFGQAVGQWDAEIKARRVFMVISIITVGLLCVLLFWISRGGFPFTRVVANVLGMLQERVWYFAWIIILVGLVWFLKTVFVSYIGDVALYVTADETSSFFHTRSQILQHATTKLRHLLRKYDSVALAGHSLGSVIAYDIINRLRTEARLSSSPSTESSEETVTREEFARLKTLITFGSPLDKVLYFFRQRVSPYETVRAHILHELHGFRQLPDLLTSDASIVDLSSPPDHDVTWINFYSPMDPISARLNLYRDVDNQLLWYWIPGLSHVSYWHDPKFYQAVLQALQRDDG